MKAGRYVKRLWWGGEWWYSHKRYSMGECKLIDLPGEMGYVLWAKEGETYHRIAGATSVELWGQEESKDYRQPTADKQPGKTPTDTIGVSRAEERQRT
jgi:hypothetical protein